MAGPLIALALGTVLAHIGAVEKRRRLVLSGVVLNLFAVLWAMAIDHFTRGAGQ